MVDKLRKKVFWIILILLTAIVTTIIVAQMIFNYTNTIQDISKIMNTYDIDAEPGIKMDDENKGISEPSELSESSKLSEPSGDTDVVYKLSVKDNEITKNENNADDKVQELAIRVCGRNNDTGIINIYMYKVRKEGKTDYSVTLVENKSTALYLRNSFLYSFALLALAIIIIFFVSKKISVIISRPVRQTFERQKQFISDASHELKTPLSIIKINAQMEEKKLGENKWNAYIQNEAENMGKLVNDLLLLSKVENIENVKKQDRFNLSKEVEIITSCFEPLAYDKKVILKTQIQTDISFYGRKEDIKNILSTLVDNAIKHTDPAGEVTVELSEERNAIILQVKNTGEPIPPEEQEKIFERFYRVDKARNRSQKRYGLGLSIAKSTIEKYGGTIRVRCENGITNFMAEIPLNR